MISNSETLFEYYHWCTDPSDVAFEKVSIVKTKILKYIFPPTITNMFSTWKLSLKVQETHTSAVKMKI